MDNICYLKIYHFMSQITFNDFVLDDESLTLSSGENIKPLTPREVDIIKYLFRKIHAPVYIEDLLNYIWGADNFWTRRMFDVYVTRLKKIFPNFTFEKDDYYLKLSPKPVE